MSAYKFHLSIVNSQTKQPIYFKQDGKRFGQSSLEERTLKLSTSVKYLIKVSLPSGSPPLGKLSIDSIDLQSEKSEEEGRNSIHTFSWLTSGFQKTSKGSRATLPFTFDMDGTKLIVKFQIKFYEFGNSQHLNWGTPVGSIEINWSEKSISGAESATVPTDVKFR